MTRHAPSSPATLSFLLLLAGTARAAGAQPSASSLLPPETPRGTIIERVACAKDPTQTYSLYLPSAYTPQRRWPLIMVLDPRGRGRDAAEIFRPAAERFGWIVMSSNDTLSDSSSDPNEKAVAAMWPDARTRVASDPRRLYTAGFSGLALVAISIAIATHDVAGVVAVGGGFPAEIRERTGPFAVFGAAGLDDFNFLRMKELSDSYARSSMVHRLQVFDGAHEWLPPAMAEQALGWFEMLAMRDGRRTRDGDLVTELLRGEMDRAEAWERDGRFVDALEQYRVIAQSFDGLTDVAGFRERAAAIERRPELAREQRDRQRWDQWQERQEQELRRPITTLVTGDELPMLAQAESQLRLPALRSQAGKDTYAGHAAHRVQNWLFAQFSFYLWRDLMGTRAFTRAAFLQQVALRIHDAPVAWFRLGLTYAAAGDRKRCLAALEQAVTGGFASLGAFDTEPDLAGLRGDPDFERLRARVAQRVSPP